MTDLSAERRADPRPCNPLTVGQLWAALTAYRYSPHLALIVLLRLLVPNGTSKEVANLLATTMAWYADFMPTDLDALEKVSELEGIDTQYKAIAVATPRAVGSGHKKASQAQDQAIDSLLTEDPDVFLRRARTLSSASEKLLDVARTMLEGGGYVETGGGGSIEVPALELKGSLQSLKGLVDTSNGLFTQVQNELHLFSERQIHREQQAQREMGEIDPIFLISALARRQLEWSEKDIANKFDVILQDTSTGYELQRIESD